jgi:hypothetical protein
MNKPDRWMKKGGLASSGRRGCHQGAACTSSFDSISCQRRKKLPLVTARRPKLSLLKGNVVWQSLLEQVNTAATQITLLSLLLTALGHVIVAGGCYPSLQ